MSDDRIRSAERAARAAPGNGEAHARLLLECERAGLDPVAHGYRGPVTRTVAMHARKGQVFYHATQRAGSEPCRATVIGAFKPHKSNAKRWRLPCQRGRFERGSIAPWEQDQGAWTAHGGWWGCGNPDDWLTYDPTTVEIPARSV